MEENAQIEDGSDQGDPGPKNDIERSMINEVVTYFSRSESRPRRRRTSNDPDPSKEFDDYYYV